MDSNNVIYPKHKEEWRKWLQKNSDKSKEIWVTCYKKHTGKPSITHMEGVEEALCYGWIDGKMKSVDEEKYIQRYTPRSDKSVWSKINKDLALRLIKEGRMTQAGLDKIKIAKNRGVWQKAYTSLKGLKIPPELLSALQDNVGALKNFRSFANSYRNIYIGWVMSARTEETKQKRIKEVVKRASGNLKSLI